MSGAWLAVAHAHSTGDDAPLPDATASPDAPPPDATASPDAPPPDAAYEACLRQRAAITAQANAATSPKERGRLFMSRPDCKKASATAGATRNKGEGQSTFEVSGGLAIFSLYSTSITRFGGLDLGAGTFVTPRVALTLRLSGGTIVESGELAYFGVLGPHAQIWVTDRVWAGAGGGLGFGIVWHDTASGEVGSGLDFRCGYSFKPYRNSVNVSLEATSVSGRTTFAAPFSDNALTVLAFLVGYQNGPHRAAATR
jgi:hypothetical protein